MRENLFIFPISPNRNKLDEESDINFRFLDGFVCLNSNIERRGEWYALLFML